jgi:hypothetical protein
MDTMHDMLHRARLVDGPGAGPLMAMLLERAGHDLGPGGMSGSRVVEARVVEGDVLLIDMAVPHVGGYETVRAMQRLLPQAPVVAVAIAISVFGSGNEIPPDSRRHCEASLLPHDEGWGAFIDRVAAREMMATAPRFPETASTS